jgi:hypothetical protein
MRRLLTAALFLVPMVSAFAQDMAPPKQVTDLGWLVGSWSGSGKITFGATTMELTTKITVSFDGQFLKAVSTDEGGGFTLTKTEMTGWDAAKGEYISYTFTNIAPAARIAHGQNSGGKLMMVSDPWMAEGMTAVFRETMVKISDTKCGLILETKKGDTWDKEMDYVLTKK